MNLLSTGNEWTDVDLNGPLTTLIVGENGSGKSTMLDALFFVLFNRPFRKINKGQLLNSITRKGLMVEVEFKKGKKTYVVRRGIKPNVFDIEVDGELLDQEAAKKDYQVELEKILGFNHKSGGAIIVLGSANYTPFMQLTTGDRRQVIEDLLDIQVYSVMNSLLKTRIVDNKEQIEDLDKDLRHVRDKLTMVDKHLEDLRSNNQEQINSHEAKIKELAAEAVAWVEEMKGYQASIDAMEVPNTAGILASRRASETARAKFTAEKTLKIKESSFLEQHQNCPTCHQEIHEDFRTGFCADARATIERLDRDIAIQDQLIVDMNAELDKIEEIADHRRSLESEVSQRKYKCEQNRKMIISIQSEIHKLQRRNTHLDIEGADKLREIETDLMGRRGELVKMQKTLSAASLLLKDGGIKAKVIRQYIPIMNQLINKYLAQMDFYIDFNLDEEFNEKILSRNRDDFVYEMFSEGEKMRIDLALLFAWRSIAKMRASASTNLLIFDEIMDSSLDGHGADEFMKILNSLSDGTKTFMISHRGDQLADKFSRVIRFKKERNFSRIEA
jgi:DNA repair exonuclease SbcCD ATPase subunit